MGGKKASKKPPPKKVAPKLTKQFTCPFCNNEKSVVAKIDYENGTGKVQCTVCGEKYETSVTALSDAIDIYSDWLDAIEAVN